MSDYDPKRPIPANQDYGHATALISTLERYERNGFDIYPGQREAAVKQLESSDFRCKLCGATMRVTRDVWPKESACEHSFGHYGIVVPDDYEQHNVDRDRFDPERT